MRRTCCWSTSSLGQAGRSWTVPVPSVALAPSHARLGWAGCSLILLLLGSALRRSLPESHDQQLPFHSPRLG